MFAEVRLLAILDPALLAGRPMLEAARAAEAGGATALQLRDKHATPMELYRATAALRSALAIPVYVNDRADIAWAAGAHGVHLGQEDVPAASLRAVRPAPFRIGISVGSPAEARASLEAGADYWSIGPLYRTATKPDAGAPLGPAGFHALAAMAPPGLPVIGIGGITAARAAEVIRAGAAGVAVIGAIFAAGDVQAAARQIRSVVDRELERRGKDGG